MASRIRSCDVASAIGRSSEKLRRSPFTEYCRAGNVTLRPPPVRRSHTLKPISFSPSRIPSVKWSSASASLPGGLLFSFGVIFTITMTLRRLALTHLLLALRIRCGRERSKARPARVLKGEAPSHWTTKACSWAQGPRQMEQEADVNRGCRASTSARGESAQEQHVGDGQLARMREGEDRSRGAQRRKPRCRAAVEPE